MSTSKENKVALLIEIREKKDILMGKFSSILDNKKKEDTWKDLTISAKAMGLLQKEKKWEDLRDKFSVWKSRTLGKRDASRKTGTGGGKNTKFSRFEEIILDIVGKDSPAMDGLPIAETWEYPNTIDNGSPPRGRITTQDVGESQLDEANKEPAEIATPTTVIDSVQDKSQNPGPSNKGVKRTRKDLEKDKVNAFGSGQDEIEKKKPAKNISNNYKDHSFNFIFNRKKLEQTDLKNELIKLETYKLRLECAEKEKNLGLEPSEYTKMLFE